MNPDTMARGLGLLSIGLGATELLAANPLAKSFGMHGKAPLIRLYGAREIAHGLSCLGTNPPTPAVWSRVAGDALDVATLLAYRTSRNQKRHNVTRALAAVIGVTVLDVLAGAWLCESRQGPITRTARRLLEKREARNERRMLALERRDGRVASDVTASAAQ